MEVEAKNNFYVVPLIGGIFCFITFFIPDTPLSPAASTLTLMLFNFMVFASLPELIFIIFGLISVISEIVCGYVMIYSAIKMKLGKTTLKKQKMKLVFFSWLVIGLTLTMSTIAMIGIGFFNLFNGYGFIGSLITLIGIYYSRHMTKHGSISGPTVIHKDEKLK